MPRSAEIASYERLALREVSAKPGSLDEVEALARIDELRDEERQGIMRFHPDARPRMGLRAYVPGEPDSYGRPTPGREATIGSSTFYRRGTSEAQIAQRRVSASRYWRRATHL